MAKLTPKQKLEALSYRFYQAGQWTPQAGDFYTTSRADLELYQVVSVEGGIVRTRYTEGSDTVSEWPETEFLTGGFGPKRVFVPEWVISAPATGWSSCCGKPIHVGSPEAYTLECCEKFVTPPDRSEMLRKIESVLNIPSAGHASAGELADTILDALGFTEGTTYGR